jgi:predicted AAA+ superfamily ATPase
MSIEREALFPLVARLKEPRRFLQVVAGPRQVGKTTLVRQALEHLQRDAQADTTSPMASPVAQHSASADGPGLQGQIWLVTQWQVARALAAQAGSCVLVLDEIQKVSQWTEEVKRLWDEDTAAGRDVRVVILGSAPLLIARGLSESMAGRFEITRLGHWRYAEMRDAFGFSLEQFIFYGGYPGAAPLVHDESRWAAYVSDALIETTISKDVLLMAPVQKPALLRRVFDLTCVYSGQILSYQKMLGQLDDAGNTTTLAHYLDLLEGAGMACGLPKYMGQVVRQRASSPKLQVFNNALMGCHWVAQGVGLQAALARPEVWGRLAESAVGAELLARHLTHSSRHPLIHCWNNGQKEVDYVLRKGTTLQALEVKSGNNLGNVSGLGAFVKQFGEAQPLVIGTGGMPLELWLQS